MDQHQHRLIPFGSELYCTGCDFHTPDTRTEAERMVCLTRGTLAAKIRVNKAMGVDSPNMRAALAELSR